MTTPDDRRQIRDTIIELTRHQHVSSRLRPEDVARTLRRGGQKELLEVIREEAVQLALLGRIVLYRKSSIADPTDFTGDYTIGNPYSKNDDYRDYNSS